MIARFCAYTTLRNLRPFDAFFVLYLLDGVGLSYTSMAAVLAYERVLSGVLEVPLAALTDRHGRRRGLIASFLCNALAFALFAYAAWAGAGLAWILAAQTVFGVGEALRTGSHKAIILDWLDGRGERERATEVIALTRMFSKTSAGFAALLGGALVYLTVGFASLFVLSAVVSAAGALLLFSYPRELEGEWTRDDRALRDAATAGADAAPAPPGWWARFRALIGLPGLLSLALASVLFETQVKLALAYLQPYLASSAQAIGLDVVGGLGALGIGAYYWLQGLAAGASSTLSKPTQRWFGGQRAALRAVHGVACVGLVTLALSLWLDVLWPGLLALLVLACLQNLRRPILVAELNAVTDPYQRATTLSLESQARSWTFAALAVVTGALADTWGLPAVFTLIAALMGCSLVALQARSPTGVRWRAPSGPTS